MDVWRVGDDIKRKLYLCFLKKLARKWLNKRYSSWHYTQQHVVMCQKWNRTYCYMHTRWILLMKSKHISAFLYNSFTLKNWKTRIYTSFMLPISWPLMSWLRKEPGHQQPCYYRVCLELSLLLRDEERCYEYTGCSSHAKIWWLSGWFMWGRVCSTDSSCIYKNSLDLVMLHRLRPRE